MRAGDAAARGVLVVALFVGGHAAAEAQTVAFAKIMDAVPAKYFSSATTDVNPGNLNQLVVGFNTGTDPVTLKSNEFRASTLPGDNRTVADTISFTVTAPTGYYVSKVTFTQKGTASTLRGAIQAGTTLWSVAGMPVNVGKYTTNPNIASTVTLDALKRKTVPVSITASLFAAAGGNIALTSANIRVEVARLP